MDIRDFIDELYALRALYSEGELCRLDFDECIARLEQINSTAREAAA